MARLLYNNQTDNLVARRDLAQMVTPPPMGRFHRPYPFAKFVDAVEDAVVARDCQVVEEEYAVTKDGQRLFGLMAITSARIEVPDDWRLLIALRGSHDQAFPRALALGSQVLVCSNLCFHGQLGVWKTRQTTNIEQRLPRLINDAVARVPEMARDLVVKYDAYRECVVEREEGIQILGDLYLKDQAFSSAQLGRALQEWDSPSYQEHAEGGWTLWRLFNASTQALKPTGSTGDPNTLQQRSERVYDRLSQIVRHKQLSPSTPSDLRSALLG